jgi:hypothetical protein
MITAKEAIDTAYKFITSLYNSTEAYNSDKLIDLALEEIELSSDEQSWLITLGFTRILSEPLERKVVIPWELATKASHRQTHTIREYKIIEVDAETGHATSMKIRKI